MSPSSLVSRFSSPASPPTFLFAGGGSGGHLFPGIAVAEELVARDPRCRIVFAGSGRGVERMVLSDTAWRHEALSAHPPGAARRNPIRFATGLAKGIRESLRLLEELRPQAVIGLGGFASVPLGIAARVRRVPLIALEQNVVPGRATSLLSHWAEQVCVSFEETAALLPRRARTVVTGNPVRAAIRTRARAAGPRPARRDPEERSPAWPASEGVSMSPRGALATLLVLGGSQGAYGVNAMATEAIASLKERTHGLHVVHQSGERDVSAVRHAYDRNGIASEVAPFFDDLAGRYREATLVITRAGATTLAELACVGRPAVLVPYPRSVRDHQRRNAERFAAAGGAVIVPEGEEASGRLAGALSDLLTRPARLTEMAAAMRRLARPDAASAVADLLLPRSAAAKAA